MEESSSGKEQRDNLKKIVVQQSSPENKNRIEEELFGYGPLEALIHRPYINEIIINNQKHIAYEEEGTIHLLEDSFLSYLTFNNIVEKLSTEASLTVNLKKPFAEGKWKDFRIHITRPPLVEKDFHVILRRHPKNIWTLEKLLSKSWAPPEAIDILKDFIKEKLNFLIVGPTSSGKTSVLNACLQELSQKERIITIEDASEIVLPNPVSLKLLTQTAPESSLALIDQNELVRQSLRLRPDRIVMGEVRGGEAKDLLLALTSGHRGSIGTLHSETHQQALWKLETLAQIGAPQWQSSTIQRLLFSSLQGVVVVSRRGNLRLLKGIYRITGLEPTGFLFESLFERNL
ncbi:MAG: ATPase, T2SS/T4P/T4SS family [Bdellovibrionales bacterium]|nr:ATPase, T2SS/T4P/T4SS family [Bdellovibrionales bacterium]